MKVVDRKSNEDEQFGDVDDLDNQASLDSDKEDDQDSDKKDSFDEANKLNYAFYNG